MVLNMADNTYTGLTSVLVGLDPSVSSGLVELINDPDKNGVFKVTDKARQSFIVKQTNGTKTRVQSYDLTGLKFENTGA